MTEAGEVRIEGLFPTPVLAEPWPLAAKFNALLRAAIGTRRQQSPGVIKSNLLGWQSDLQMLEWGGEAARALSDHVLHRCEGITADLRGADHIRFYPEMWANVSPTRASNQTHAHPGAYWSAVYYVDDGYAGSSQPDVGGELVLYDPRMPFVRMLPFELRYRKPDGTAADSQVSIRPTAGQIVMFPPWLYHSVHPFTGAGTRISIAMNATVTK